jgi:hypothetical protein
VRGPAIGEVDTNAHRSVSAPARARAIPGQPSASRETARPSQVTASAPTGAAAAAGRSTGGA